MQLKKHMFKILRFLEPSIECTYCGTQNKKGRKYCWKCGKPLIYTEA